VSAVGEIEMVAVPKRATHQDDCDERKRQDKALDEALKNTFPASDPVSVEQPTSTCRRPRQGYDLRDATERAAPSRFLTNPA
jgi:hypothetical protein